MTINTFKIIILLSLSSSTLFAQEYCGTKQLDEDWISYYHDNKDLFALEGDKTIYAPMQLNILRDDEGKGEVSFMLLYRTLSKLNSDFQQVGVQFYLFKDFIKIDKTSWYNHEAFSGGAQMMNAQNVRNAINCYIVRNPAGNCGYYSPRQDGLALGMNCMGGSSSTWTHEMGHLLTLPHTFYGCEGVDYVSGTNVIDFSNEIWGKLERVDGSNCSTAADRFCDTKPDYLSYRWRCNNDGESSLLQTDLAGKTFRSNGEMFMSYSNDICTGVFSGEQIQAMRANLNGKRNSILKDTTPQIRNLADDIELEMILPIKDEVVHYQNIVLEWKEIEGATHYYVEVSRRSNFNGGHTIREVVTAAKIEIDELSIGRKYYLRVLPFNLSAFNQDFLEVKEFKTENLTNIENSIFVAGLILPSLIQQGQNLVYTLPRGNKYNNLTYSINSLIGQEVLNGQLKETSSQIVTSGLNCGVYMIKLINNHKNVGTRKFIIQ